MQVRVSDEVRLKDVPPALESYLKDRLTFPNPKWLENHRMGRWNRGTPKVLKFYRRHKSGAFWLPRGFLRQLILICRKEGIAIDLEDARRRLPDISFSFSGILKPFQKTAVNQMMPRDFGTLSAPTGSGKTVMGLAIIVRRRQPTLVVVHTKELAFQWMDRIETFLGIPASDIGLIGDGKKRIGDAITVALVQSLYKIADEVAPVIGHLVVDECHRCPSRLFTEAVTAFDSQYMLGLSATPFRRDGLSRLIFWHLGDAHVEIEREQLEQSGDVMAAEVVFRETGFSPYFDPVNEYSRMLSELTGDDARNRLIAADVAAEVERSNGVCLVLTDRKKHCDLIRSLIRFKHGVPCDLLTGDVKNEERRDVIQRLQNAETRAVVATGQLVGEGFDCPNLSSLFLATPIRFSGRVLQYLGRVLRPAPGKDQARVFDYVDARVDVLMAAARARRRVYFGQNPPRQVLFDGEIAD